MYIVPNKNNHYIYIYKLLLLYNIKTCEPCAHNQHKLIKAKISSSIQIQMGDSIAIRHYFTWRHIFIRPPQQRCPPIG